MHTFYHCMGEYDGVTIYEVPDEATASALILSIKGPGHLKEVETTELHTVETAMEGMRKASEIILGALAVGREVFSLLRGIGTYRDK